MVYYRKTKLIGQLLLEKRMITQDQLTQASLEQRRTGKLLGSILIKSGVLNEEGLFQALSEQLGTEYIRLKYLRIPRAVIQEIPAKFATRYALIPIDIDRNRITVAMSNPTDLLTIDNLRFLLEKEIKAVLSSENEIDEAIKRYYGVGADTIGEMVPELAVDKPIDVQQQVKEDIIKFSEAPTIVKFVNQLILEAYNSRATDIHIEPYEDELVVRYRIDGLLYDASVPANIKELHLAIVSRIKIMANLDIAERRLPQDGRIKIKIIDDELDLRVSIFPSLFGEDVVIRLLSTNVLYGLNNLGFSSTDLQTFENLIRKPHGIIFLTGPTGSGKTTTLYAALSTINTTEKKIVTIEDPIEYQLKRVMQTQVHPKIGLTFSHGLRAMLRHDPDIMMVGEVRDYETAEITVRVALTGHLVLSTLHTNDAAGGITRLIDMGIEPFLIASSVNAFVAQRLVRVICPNCKTVARVEQEVLAKLGSSPHEVSRLTVFEGEGCEFCNFTGYKGRTAIYEILVVNSAIRELMLKRASAEQIKNKGVELGMRTLRQDGWQKVMHGITTPEEVIRVSQQEESV